jgi:hypothetical protein
MFLEEEDFIELDESDFVDTPTTEESSEVETNVEQTSETEVKTEQQGLTKEQVLEFMNAQGMKYNGESVKIENFDDLVSTYQKGLNYDKVKSKADEKENSINSVMSYVEKKAKSMGLTAEQYIQKVETYEKEQEKAKIESQIQNMMDRGIDEETARSVAETRAYMETLKNEKAEFEKQKAEMEAQKNKDKEYEEFLKEYPDVKAEEIPAEVFENAKTMGLKSAYAQYENKLLKQQIKQMEQNKNNASSSLVSATSNGSNTEQESKDAFLMGFDS